MSDTTEKGGPEIKQVRPVKELDPGFKNDWHSTLEALRASNKVKDELISDLLADMVALENSLRHSKLALLRAYEDYRKKLEGLQGQLKPRWYTKYLKRE